MTEEEEKPYPNTLRVHLPASAMLDKLLVTAGVYLGSRLLVGRWGLTEMEAHLLGFLCGIAVGAFGILYGVRFRLIHADLDDEDEPTTP